MLLAFHYLKNLLFFLDSTQMTTYLTDLVGLFGLPQEILITFLASELDIFSTSECNVAENIITCGCESD